MPSFEEQLTELEKVVEQLEKGDLPLEDSVALFERGMQLSEACKGELASAESRIQVLVNPREKGPVRVEELVEDDDEEVTSEEYDQLASGKE